MNIIRFAINNPVKIAVGVILLVLFGLRSVFEIPIQLTPSVDRPVITISTQWTGASPQEIETEIVDRQEYKLKNVPNLVKMTSTSSEGGATIRLEFPVGVDKDVAFRHASDRLRQVTGYPDEVDEPVVTATDSDMEDTIAWMILSAQDGRDVATLKTFIVEQVKPILERAGGISEVPVYGGRDREIQIEIDPHLLAARGLSFRDVERAVRRRNRNISAGTITQGKRDYSYRTMGEYTSLKHIEDTVIAFSEGGTVRVSDVGRVIDGLKKQYAFVRSKGKYVIAMPARRETGANVIKTMQNLQEKIALVNREVLEPKGLTLELTQVYDETVYIKSAIRLVLINILFGGSLAIGVLWLFLRSGSATGIIAVAIPISVVGTFLVITLLGRTLNVVMLAGMAFAVGMLVDNSVVVLENIYRHRAMGKPRFQAALDGAREVWGAVLASSLTTMAVFLPVIFIQEEVGQLFKDIAIAIVSAVGLSLVVSVLVVPAVAARYLHISGARGDTGGDHAWAFGRWVAALVGKINNRVLSRVAVVAGLSGVSVLGSWLLMPATDYLPAGNENLVFGFLFSPPGYSIDEYRRMAEMVEEGDPNDPYDGLRPAWEAELHSAEAAMLPPVDIPIGTDRKRIQTVTPPPIENFFFVAYGGAAFMGCTSKDPNNVAPLVQLMTRAGARLPGVFAVFNQTSLFGGGRAGNSIDLEIRGEHLDSVVASASAIMGRIMQAGYSYPRPDPANFALGRPEVQLIADPAKAARLGLDVRDIGFIIEACVDGAFVGEYNDRGDKVDMALTVARTGRMTVEEVGQIPVYTPSGNVVPIASVVELRRTTAPQQIKHIEEMDAVTLSITPQPGVPLQDTMSDLQDNVIAPLRQSGAIPPSIITTLAGTASKLTQTRHALLGNFDGVVRQPRLLGLSVSASMLLLILILLGAATVVRFIGGPRMMAVTVIVGTAALGLGFLILNPEFGLTILQSRMILALMITYLLMAGLFESFAYPFIIMFSVPLAAVGGFAALRIVHELSLRDVSAPTQQFDVLTMLGFVILIGVVVNNAILIVHQALNFMSNDHLEPATAIARSVQTRTRPIFMTMLTSVFGMFPLVVMTGPGSELYRGLGSVLVGGLMFSTVFTLLVVPAIFTLVLDVQRWLTPATQRVPGLTSDSRLGWPSAGKHGQPSAGDPPPAEDLPSTGDLPSTRPAASASPVVRNPDR